MFPPLCPAWRAATRLADFAAEEFNSGSQSPPEFSTEISEVEGLAISEALGPKDKNKDIPGELDSDNWNPWGCLAVAGPWGWIPVEGGEEGRPVCWQGGPATKMGMRVIHWPGMQGFFQPPGWVKGGGVWPRRSPDPHRLRNPPPLHSSGFSSKVTPYLWESWAVATFEGSCSTLGEVCCSG